MMLDFVFVCDWEQKWNDFVEAKRSFETRSSSTPYGHN